MPSSVTNDISPDICCPICQSTMVEATVLVPSGHSYCFNCIFEHLTTNPNRDPITNVHYTHIDLIPNHTLISMIEKLNNTIPVQIEENENIIVDAKIIKNNPRICKFGKNCKRRGCWFNHPEGQASLLTIH